LRTGIIIIGALGRMGREIAEIVLNDETLHLQGAIEPSGHPQSGKDYMSCLGKGTGNITVSSSIDECITENAVCIDFSSPHSVSVHLPVAVQNKVPVVIGTTGITDKEIEIIKSFSSEIPVLFSPNMSLGVNLLFSLTEIVAKRLKNDYDIEIIEAHHRFKKDAPSGTAKRLGEIAADAIGLPYDSCVVDGRKGITQNDRSRKEIGMHAIRGGDIVGEHTVLFAGIGEQLSLRHQAHNRSTFAGGAVVASKWIAQHPPGFYSMRDLLGF
jgi:4-hydroxy-tetrahydrodipicolinate reductase